MSEERYFTCGRVLANTMQEALKKLEEQVRQRGFTPRGALRAYETHIPGWYEYYIEIEAPM
ncbi:hypothetical protein kuro4_00820 [Gelria sp. Kuro-4]|nr:hypothetical protein kuro4_00820 [Gelria sp. Kuro-4]